MHDTVLDACCVHPETIPLFSECLIECMPCTPACIHAGVNPGEPQSLNTCAYMAFFGFGSVETHTALIHVLQDTLCPVLLHSSFVKHGRFEGILSIRECQKSDSVERLLDCFTMSIGTVEINTYMGESMITCLQRIGKGTQKLGNINTPQNEHVRARLQLESASLQILMYVEHRALFVYPHETTLSAYEMRGQHVFLNVDSILYTPSYMHTPPQMQALESETQSETQSNTTHQTHVVL